MSDPTRGRRRPDADPRRSSITGDVDRADPGQRDRAARAHRARPDPGADRRGREPADVLPGEVRGIIRRTVGHVQAVDGVSFQVPAGGSLGLVGESGCGKSTLGRMITRLYTPTGGSIRFGENLQHDLVKLSNSEMKPLRQDVQMIFQDPYSSLNPRHTVGSIVGAP